MKLKALLFVTVLGALFCTAASAKLTRVSLITVSPGNDLFAAFGHTALVFEDSETPNEAMIYEYGAPTNDLEVLRLNTTEGEKKMKVILEFFTKLTSGKVKTTGMAKSSAIAAEDQFPAAWAKRNYFEQSKEPNKIFREVTMSPLSMTEEQILALKKTLDDDLASGPYLYDNYRRNCATKIRDPLYGDAIVGKTEREKLENAEAKRDGAEDRISYQDIAIDSIDDAAELSCRGKAKSCVKTVYLVPERNMSDPDVMAFLNGLKKMGMDYKFTSGKDSAGKNFYKSLTAADQSMSLLRSFAPLPPDAEALADALHAFISDKMLIKKPISRYEAAYTPKRLRAILLESINPATNKPMIDPATEIRKDNLEAIKLLSKPNGDKEQQQQQQAQPR